MGIGTPQKTTGTTGTGTLDSKNFYLKSKETMKYDITKPKAPAMPPLKNVTKSIPILL